jgi:hypothetical protein
MEGGMPASPSIGGERNGGGALIAAAGEGQPKA